MSKTAGLDHYEVGLEYELDMGSYKLQNCSRNDGKLKQPRLQYLHDTIKQFSDWPQGDTIGASMSFYH